MVVQMLSHRLNSTKSKTKFQTDNVDFIYESDQGFKIVVILNLGNLFISFELTSFWVAVMIEKKKTPQQKVKKIVLLWLSTEKRTQSWWKTVNW